MKEKQSPMIGEIGWGLVRVEGYGTPFRDVKLFPGGAREWDWRETDTHHSPGIQPADEKELIERGAEVIVLSTGFQERLGVCSETLQMLEEAGVTAHVCDSEQAVSLYNSLIETELAGALIHSTC